jgi:2-hydroxychromene-2-carboxylate isomerase
MLTEPSDPAHFRKGHVKTIDYFIFPNSPYAYMGHARLVDMARRHGATIHLKPMDAARVFPVSGGLPLSKRAPQRVAYRMTELKRWREFLGLPMNVEPKFFPVAGDAAARLIAAAREVADAAAIDLAGRVLKAVWEEERNIADEATLVALASESGLDGSALLVRSHSAEIRARYDAFTQEAIERQVFGAPTYVYKGELFWGQDRLDFLERALTR